LEAEPRWDMPEPWAEPVDTRCTPDIAREGAWEDTWLDSGARSATWGGGRRGRGASGGELRLRGQRGAVRGCKLERPAGGPYEHRAAAHVSAQGSAQSGAGQGRAESSTAQQSGAEQGKEGLGRLPAARTSPARPSSARRRAPAAQTAAAAACPPPCGAARAARWGGCGRWRGARRAWGRSWRRLRRASRPRSGRGCPGAPAPGGADLGVCVRAWGGRARGEGARSSAAGGAPWGGPRAGPGSRWGEVGASPAGSLLLRVGARRGGTGKEPSRRAGAWSHGACCLLSHLLVLVHFEHDLRQVVALVGAVQQRGALGAARGAGVLRAGARPRGRCWEWWWLARVATSAPHAASAFAGQDPPKLRRPWVGQGPQDAPPPHLISGVTPAPCACAAAAAADSQAPAQGAPPASESGAVGLAPNALEPPECCCCCCGCCAWPALPPEPLPLGPHDGCGDTPALCSAAPAPAERGCRWQ
jgi:hypothetical protein